jgi:NTE family protein
MYESPTTGLVLSGGGARAGYQIGVLRAIARLRRQSGADLSRNPFGVICGTSAGAINAAALASRADEFDAAVADLVQIWGNFHAHSVYRADSLGVLRSGAQWLTMLSIGWIVAKWRRARPRSLLDNSPLASLLLHAMALDRLPHMLNQGHLKAFAVSAFSYTSGRHVTFCESATKFERWERSQRVAVSSRINISHLLASSAIPFVFPSVELDCQGRQEWFGDGSMRQVAPISPAVHLGADRVLVVGVGRIGEPSDGRALANNGYPSLALIAGHALSNIFLDALAVDIERMTRINKTLALLPEAARQLTTLRPIDVLVISPSKRLDDIAALHQADLPIPVRAMLRGLGAGGKGSEARGSALTSYLLFESSYTRALMDLGMTDTLARRDEVIRFFGWPARPVPTAASKLENV